MHPLKAIRLAAFGAAESAAISVLVSGVAVAVKVLRHPPSDAAVPDNQLPAIFCYIRSELITPETLTKDRRDILLDFVIQTKGVDAVDQVDDIHLALEVAIASSRNLGGVVLSIRPVGSEINIQRGEVIFAARRVTFEAFVIVDRANPSI